MDDNERLNKLRKLISMKVETADEWDEFTKIANKKYGHIKNRKSFWSKAYG